MHIVDGGDVHNGEAYHRPEDCQPGYACWNGVSSNPYATTRLDALRKLRREGYAVVDAKSWRLRSDFGVVPHGRPLTFCQETGLYWAEADLPRCSRVGHRHELVVLTPSGLEPVYVVSRATPEPQAPGWIGTVEAEPTEREHCRAVHANACSCCLDLHHFGDHRTLWGDTWSQAARTRASNGGGE